MPRTASCSAVKLLCATAGAVVAIDVVKAQNIHVENYHVDTGHFQFFNGAIDTVVAGNVGERMGGSP